MYYQRIIKTKTKEIILTHTYLGLYFNNKQISDSYLYNAQLLNEKIQSFIGEDKIEDDVTFLFTETQQIILRGTENMVITIHNLTSSVYKEYYFNIPYKYFSIADMALFFLKKEKKHS